MLQQHHAPGQLRFAKWQAGSRWQALQVVIGHGDDGHAQAHHRHARQRFLAVQLHLLAHLQMLAAQLLLDLPPGPGTLVEAQERLAGQQLRHA